MIFWIWYGVSLFILISALGIRIFLDLRKLRKEHDKLFNYEQEKTTDRTTTATTGERQRLNK